ncbi:MAG: hypothetical protein BMS9Abin33_0359 [Gammaproteobacteria bacterium]|nr:MAG: hypothetical protein BMS9Abin33_0359 [Gammaproteobacteria bacterium]
MLTRRQRHSSVIGLAKSRLTAVGIAMVYGFMLTACDFHVHPLERKAVNTISVLIMEPEQKDVSESADKPVDPESMVQGRTAKNTIKYLRARRKQGLDLGFKLGSRTVLDESHQVVTVVVDESGEGVLGVQQASYLFSLSFNKNNGEWQLTRIRVER